MVCNNCGLEFNEELLSQVVAHEHQSIVSIEKDFESKCVSFRVVSIFNDKSLFEGYDWECRKYIEDTYGNGFLAIMHRVIKNN